MPKPILGLEDIQKRYSFYFEDEDSNDNYFCSCGQFFLGKINEEKMSESMIDLNSESITEDLLVDKQYGSLQLSDDFADVYQQMKESFNDDILCPGCNTNYSLSENKRKLITIGTEFISGFEFIENEETIILYYSKVKPEIKPTETLKEGSQRKHDVFLTEQFKYIILQKNSKKVFFKDFSDEVEREIDLDEVLKVSNIFFQEHTPTIINGHKLQMFVNRLANFVSDSQNIDIINELLENVRNNPNTIGLEHIKKIVSIFLGIVRYSNLSTIALTKGSVFLYELMRECEIPKPDVLEENQITSPIKIFNFLAQNYIKKLNEEVNEDNKEVHEFVYKSSQQQAAELTIKLNTGDGYKEGKVINDKGGKYQVLSAVEDGTISKFIYKAIRRFSDYKQLIKYLKFSTKDELIELLKRYDTDFLVNVIDMIYFRDGINFKEINKLFPILISYVEIKMSEFAPLSEGQELDYSYLKGFDFSFFDDSILMLTILKFDKRRHFDKIKTYPELKEYHDKLVQYFKAVSDKDKNEEFQKFVSKFKYLEEKGEYDGPLEFKLIATPEMLIREGVELKHSASSYVGKVLTKTYLISQIFDRSENVPDGEHTRYTIGLNYDSTQGLSFDQLKTYGNSTGSDRLKQLVMEFLTSKDISYQMIKDLRLKNE